MSLQKNTAIAVVLAIAVVALFVTLGFFGRSGFDFGFGSPEPVGPQGILEELQATGSVAELQTYDFTRGEGEAVAIGDIVAVHYIGVLPDGSIFDSSRERGEPFVFELGAGQVIPGWEQGISGMRVGGRRLIAVPPQLGYGANAVGDIPPNSTLIFDVEVLEILPVDETSNTEQDS